MNNKLTLLNEIKQYIPYDDRLSNEDKERLLSLDCNFITEWAKVVYDYFYSHLSDSGEIISLNQFLLKNEKNKEHYKKVEELFISNLLKKQKPLFFFDVDNTLTNWGELSKQKIDFIKNFPHKHRIILTTGKTYDSILSVVKDCGLEGNYASCLNGSVLVENGKIKALEKIGKISEEIVKSFENAPFDTIVYYEDYIRLLRPLTEKNYNFLKTYTEKYLEEKIIDYNKVVKVLLFIDEGEIDKEEIVKKVVKNYPNLVCMRTSNHTYEILNKNQHKGNTVKIISKLMGNHYRATIGVGDSMNDSPLLSHVGKPYVVSTASLELKNFNYDVLEENRDVDIVNLIKRYTKGEKYE